MGVATFRVGRCGRDGPGCGAPTGLTFGDGGIARPNLGGRPPLGRPPPPIRAGRRGAGAGIVGMGLLVLEEGAGAGVPSVGMDAFIMRSRWLACCCQGALCVALFSPSPSSPPVLDEGRQVKTKRRGLRSRLLGRQERRVEIHFAPRGQIGQNSLAQTSWHDGTVGSNSAGQTRFQRSDALLGCTSGARSTGGRSGYVGRLKASVVGRARKRALVTVVLVTNSCSTLSVARWILVRAQYGWCRGRECGAARQLGWSKVTYIVARVRWSAACEEASARWGPRLERIENRRAGRDGNETTEGVQYDDCEDRTT